MRGILNKLVRTGLDLMFGKPEPIEYHPTTPLCPNCKRPL